MVWYVLDKGRDCNIIIIIISIIIDLIEKFTRLEYIYQDLLSRNMAVGLPGATANLCGRGDGWRTASAIVAVEINLPEFRTSKALLLVAF